MAGSEVLAFLSSENAFMGKRLQIPSNLLGLSGNVVVTHVVIEDHSAYGDAAVQAETVRW
jgi:hypothetical protein